jgi:hypothetical protein
MHYIETHFRFLFGSDDGSIEFMLVIMLVILVVVAALRFGALQ